jgi:hypothetical protein
MYRQLPLAGWPPRPVPVTHRVTGFALFAPTVPVAVHCLIACGVQLTSLRVAVHSVAGCFSTARPREGAARAQGCRSAAAAPPQQECRNRSWRLDEALSVQPGVKQGVQEGGQLTVCRTYPDPGTVGIVIW